MFKCYKYKKVIQIIYPKAKIITILKQVKGEGVVILDTTKYTEKLWQQILLLLQRETNKKPSEN